MAADPVDSGPHVPPGPGRHEALCAELRELRTHGLSRSRTLQLPLLVAAAGDLGHLDDDTPIGEALEVLLGRAVDRLGESREATAARFTFGLARGSKLSVSTDRRRSAAQAQGVSVERFRKGYEPLLVSSVAEQVQAMLALATSGPAPTAEPAAVFTGEHQVAEVLAAARNSADWDLVEGVYRQCVDIAEDQDGHDIPPGIAGFLAEAFGRIAANYYGREDELVLHALGILGNIDRSETISAELFARLYADDRFDRFRQYTAAAGGPLRRPRPFESLVETSRRYRDLNALRAALSGVPSAGILGGSVNYGRFYTVRGSHGPQPGSDLDLLVVLPDYGGLAAAARALRAVHAISRTDLDALDERVRLFAEHGFDDGRTVFSHPVTMWSDRPDPVMAWAPDAGRYRLDLRFLSQVALDWLLVADTSKLNGGAAGSRRSVREYCPPGAPAEDHQRSFSGRNLRHPQPADEVPGGMLRASRAYTIDGDDERYYPGVLQNLVLPRFAQRWESVPINGRLMAFRWKAIERLRYERRRRPYELLRMSLAHTRSEMFAPHVLRSVDGSDSTA